MASISKVCEYARRYVEYGLKVIPLRSGDKRPIGKWKDITVEEALEVLCNKPANVGIVCGEPSGGLVVLDFDSMELAHRFLERLVAVNKALASKLNWVVETGKGLHIYLRVSCVSADISTRKLGKIDLKGEGGYVVAPPSLHPSGKEYRFIGGLPGEPPVEVNCEEWQTILSILEEVSGKNLAGNAGAAGQSAGNCIHITGHDRVVELLRPYYVPGHRNNIVFSLLGLLVKHNICYEDARRIVELLALSTGDEEAKHRLYLVEYHYSKRLGLNLKGSTGLKEEIVAVLKERGVNHEEAEVEAGRVLAQLAYMLGLRRGTKSMWLRIVDGRVVSWVVIGKTGIYVARDTSSGRSYDLISPAVVTGVRRLRSEIVGDMYAVSFSDGGEVVGTVEDIVNYIKRRYGLKPGSNHIVGRLIVDSATSEEELVYAPGVWFNGEELRFHRRANYNPPWRRVTELDIPVPPKEPSQAAREALRRFLESYGDVDAAVTVIAYGLVSSLAHYFRQRYGYWPHMVLYGRRGTGKSTLLEMLELMYGAPLRERVPTTEFRARKLLAETTLPALIEEANELLVQSSRYAGALEVLHSGVTVTRLATVHHAQYGGVFLSIRSAIMTTNYGVELPDHMLDKILVVEIDRKQGLDPEKAQGYTPNTMSPELRSELRGVAYYFIAKIAERIKNMDITVTRESLVREVLDAAREVLYQEIFGKVPERKNTGAEKVVGMAKDYSAGITEEDIRGLFVGWANEKLGQIASEIGKDTFTPGELKSDYRLLAKLFYGYPVLVQHDTTWLVATGNALRWFRAEMRKRGVELAVSVGMIAKMLGMEKRRVKIAGDTTLYFLEWR